MADSIPVDQVYKNLPTPAPQQSGSVSADDVYKNFPQFTSESAAKPESTTQPMDKMVIESENKRLGGYQFTSPYYKDYKPEKDLGEASTDDADLTWYKDKEGNSQKTDSGKHVVLRNPDDGKFHVLERSSDTDYGPIKGRLMGLGSYLQDAFASTSPVTGGVGATAAQKALQAQQAIQNTTGVSVPVSRAAVAPGFIARTISHVPGVNTTFEHAAAQTGEGLSQASEAAAQTVGNARNAEGAGEAVRGGLDQYLAPKREGGILAQKVGKAFDAVDSSIDAAAKVPLTNTMKVAQDINLERLASERPDEYGQAVKEVMGAVTNPEGLSYSALKSLRTSIGELMERTTSDVSHTELSRLYKGLSDDTRALVQAHGDRATQLWDRANTMNVAANARRDQLAKILGNSTKSDEATFSTMLRLASTNASADAKTLAAAKKSMHPDEWAEFVSGAVQRMGRNGEGASEVFDPSKWVRDYSKMSEAGKNLMFGESTKLRQSLESISHLASEWPAMARLGREPGEVGHAALLIGGLESARGEGAVGALKLMAGVTGMKMVAKFLSRPATAANVARYIQSYKLAAFAPTKGNIVALTKATNIMAKDAAEEDRNTIGDKAKTAGQYAVELIKAVHGQ